MKTLKASLERITRDITTLAEITSAQEKGYTRLSFSEEDRRAREHVARLMEEEAKLTVRIDAVGNLIGTRKGRSERPSIVLGSHLDTVRGGGRFDGTAGVVAGLEVARVLSEERIEALHPLEVVVFLAEEPSRFGISTVGSRAMAGRLPEDLLNSLKDDEGRTLGTGIEMMGGNPARISEARRSPDDILAYLELHIEQGPLLFSSGIPIGVVTDICGIYRRKIQVIGKCDHAGTTPMAVRKDALTATSEVILAFERICRGLDGVVGTVGRMEVFPNTSNVVPGRVTLVIEVRSHLASRATEAISLLEKALEDVQERRGVRIRCEPEPSSDPVVFDERMVDRIAKACQRRSISYQEMPSGAAHDASHMAELAPTGMVFVPSEKGRSHCPEEWSEFEHICLGTDVLTETVGMIDVEDRF